MAREEKGVSLLSSDATEGGLYQGGEAKLTFEFVEKYEYKKKVGRGTIATVLLVTCEDENGEKHEEPYGVGQSAWGVSKDGGRLIPKAGQTGLPKSCDTMKYMIGPIEQALQDAKLDWPEGFTESFDVSLLNGLQAKVKRVVADRTGMPERTPARPGQKSFDPTKLVVQEIISAPWAEGNGKAASGKSKKSRDDDDDDDKPAKGKASGKGKGGDTDAKETAIEWLLDALTDADDKTISKKDLEKTIRRAHRKEPDAKVDPVIDWLDSDDNLELEKGWLYDGKQLTLDE